MVKEITNKDLNEIVKEHPDIFELDDNEIQQAFNKIDELKKLQDDQDYYNYYYQDGYV